jgi:hypothetical protein
MDKETQNSDNCQNLFKSVIDELHWITQKQILPYYEEKDIIPVIEQLRVSGWDIAKVISSEIIKELEEHKIPKKQNFASWMLDQYGKPNLPRGKI